MEGEHRTLARLMSGAALVHLGYSVVAENLHLPLPAGGHTGFAALVFTGAFVLTPFAHFCERRYRVHRRKRAFELKGKRPLAGREVPSPDLDDGEAAERSARMTGTEMAKTPERGGGRWT